jgi:hypothetical protein
MNCLFCHLFKNIASASTYLLRVCVSFFFFLCVCVFVLCYLLSFFGFQGISFTPIIAPLLAISLLLPFEKAMQFISPLSCSVGESLTYLSQVFLSIK